jgi:hypothetical protein
LNAVASSVLRFKRCENEQRHRRADRRSTGSASRRVSSLVPACAAVGGHQETLVLGAAADPHPGRRRLWVLPDATDEDHDAVAVLSPEPRTPRDNISLDDARCAIHEADEQPALWSDLQQPTFDGALCCSAGAPMPRSCALVNSEAPRGRVALCYRSTGSSSQVGSWVACRDEGTLLCP